MAHLSSSMPDARMVPPHQHMTMESPAGSSVLAPLSTTTSSQPTALRRASYIRVADLVKAFKVDNEKLKEELDKLNDPDSRDVAAKLSDEASDEATGKEKNATEATEAEAESGKETPESAPKVSNATTALSKLRLSSSKENVSEEQFQQRGKTVFRKKLSPPSGGYNLCLLVGSVDIVVDKLRVDRSRVRLAEVMVGDETGCVYLRARDSQIDTLKEISERKGAVVLRNATIEVFQGRFLRLAITKWGKISSFPDQVASTPSPPKAINESLNYSAINLNLVVKEASIPSSPDSPSSSSSQQQLSTAESGRYRKPSRGESFDDSRSTRSYASNTSRSKGRKGSRKQGQQYQYHRPHGGKQGVVHPQGSPTSQPYPAPYPGVYAGIPIQGMSSFPAAAMYPHSSQGGSPELPQYTYQARKTAQVMSPHEAEHHRKHQALIAQQYELQQHHHYQQMQLFQQQQENHQRLLQAQQHQFSPRLTPGTRNGDAAAIPSSSLPASAFPPMEGSPTRAVPMFDDGVTAHATPLSPHIWPGGHEQTPPTSPMNPRARTFAPTHDQMQAPQIPYAMYDPSLQHHAAPGTSSATPVAAVAYGSPLSNHQLYSQVAATMPYVPPIQDGSPPDETQPHDHQHQRRGPPKSK